MKNYPFKKSCLYEMYMMGVIMPNVNIYTRLICIPISILFICLTPMFLVLDFIGVTINTFGE